MHSMLSMSTLSIQFSHLIELCIRCHVIHNNIALIFCVDHLNMPFNVHTTDKVTMMTMSGFLTILFEVGLTVIQTLIQSEL